MTHNTNHDALQFEFEMAISRNLNSILLNPPRMLADAGKLIQKFTSHVVFNLNRYLEPPATGNSVRRTQIFVLVTQAIGKLLDAMMKSYDSFSVYHNLDSHSPYSTIMGLFVVMAHFVAITEDRWSHYMHDIPKPMQITQSVHQTLPYIVKSYLCVSRKPLKSYTAKEVDDALFLLGAYWHRLEPHPDLKRYLQALLHRACMLVGTPQCVAGVDEEEMDRKATNYLRLFSMQLVRMLFIFDIYARCTIKPASTENLPELLERVRKFELDQSEIFMKTSNGLKEITAIYHRLCVIFGDPERFKNERGMMDATPKIMILTTRPETQQATVRLQQFIVLSAVIKHMRDEEPNYWSEWQMEQHAYSILLRTYCMNMVMKQFDINFFLDFVIYELDLPMAMPVFSKRREPVLIQLFGRMHVFFAGTVHICTCIDHAIITWCRIVLGDLNGKLETKSNIKKDVRIALQRFLGLYQEQAEASGVHGQRLFKPTKNETKMSEGDVVMD